MVNGGRAGSFARGWRAGEVWLEPDDVHWFGELKRSVQAAVPPEPLLVGVGAGALAPPFPPVDRRFPRSRPLPAHRRPRISRGRRLATRLAPLVAALAAAGIGIPALVASRSAEDGAGLPPLTPSATVREDASERARLVELREAAPSLATPSPTQASSAKPLGTGPEAPFAAIRWRKSKAVGLPYAGRLVNGVSLPIEGPDWVTWDPARDRVPNRANRLYGTDTLVRMTLDVIAAYRAAHPAAPRVVIGDLSRRGGGEIDEHASHENGLDVDVYYPRRDGRALPPRSPAQVDLRLAQDLVDRFVAAGAQILFVGQSLPFRGPAGIVVPYPEHDNHVHVRIPPP